jgi:DNA-binding GntR family transcriptional regulator
MEFQGKSDVITAALRELIITGEVEPGSPLRQRELAQRFGVSPTPIREALRRLEAEGLVHHDLHRGVTVIDANFDPDHESYIVRAALEALAARAAAERIDAEELEEIQAIQDRFEACAADDPELAELNRRFHFAIYQAAKSPMLLALLRLLWQSMGRGPVILRPHGDSSKQHDGIIQALRDGDQDAAERLTREHILGALEYLRVPPEPSGKGTVAATGAAPGTEGTGG